MSVVVLRTTAAAPAAAPAPPAAPPGGPPRILQKTRRESHGGKPPAATPAPPAAPPGGLPRILQQTRVSVVGSTNNYTHAKSVTCHAKKRDMSRALTIRMMWCFGGFADIKHCIANLVQGIRQASQTPQTGCSVVGAVRPRTAAGTRHMRDTYTT